MKFTCKLRELLAARNMCQYQLAAAAQEFTLRAGFAGPHELESPVWCQQKAFALHNYLVRNCAWGVYKHLRQMMADENRLAEERRRDIAE